MYTKYCCVLQELQNKQIKIAKNNINVVNVNLSRSQTSLSKQNPENEIQYDNTPLVSQCPLCFGLYPKSDIEVINTIKLIKYLIIN